MSGGGEQALALGQTSLLIRHAEKEYTAIQQNIQEMRCRYILFPHWLGGVR